ncbi:hypothetical protein [Streptomyces sp. ADI97-07]|uniref:hypothetical protein n=1 Tax=Streptomyces sp. ADI97-07 TaxID=1522762 RepID=UPI000F555217|nr:hypothetical protein [Streptomyces sp. ADI97-07]
MVDIAVAVGLVALVLRAVVRRGLTPGSLLLALVVGGLGLWRGLGPGPGWLLWPAVALLVVTAADFFLSARSYARMPRTDAAEVKAQLLADCRSGDGRQQLTLAVAPGGAVLMDGIWGGHGPAGRRDAGGWLPGLSRRGGDGRVGRPGRERPGLVPPRPGRRYEPPGRPEPRGGRLDGGPGAGAGLAEAVQAGGLPGPQLNRPVDRRARGR